MKTTLNKTQRAELRRISEQLAALHHEVETQAGNVDDKATTLSYLNTARDRCDRLGNSVEGEGATLAEHRQNTANLLKA